MEQLNEELKNKRALLQALRKETEYIEGLPDHKREECKREDPREYERLERMAKEAQPRIQELQREIGELRTQLDEAELQKMDESQRQLRSNNDELFEHCLKYNGDTEPPLDQSKQSYIIETLKKRNRDLILANNTYMAIVGKREISVSAKKLLDGVTINNYIVYWRHNYEDCDLLHDLGFHSDKPLGHVYAKQIFEEAESLMLEDLESGSEPGTDSESEEPEEPEETAVSKKPGPTKIVEFDTVSVSDSEELATNVSDDEISVTDSLSDINVATPGTVYIAMLTSRKTRFILGAYSTYAKAFELMNNRVMDQDDYTIDIFEFAVDALPFSN